MSNICTSMIASGSAQIMRIELMRGPGYRSPMVGFAMILYRQFEWSAPREFRLEIRSVEVEKLLIDAMHRRQSIQLDVYRPEGLLDPIEKLLARLRHFFGRFRSNDIASMSSSIEWPKIGLPE